MVDEDDHRGPPPAEELAGEIQARAWLDIDDPSQRPQPPEGDLPDDLDVRPPREGAWARLMRTLRGG